MGILLSIWAVLTEDNRILWTEEFWKNWPAICTSRDNVGHLESVFVTYWEKKSISRDISN